MIDQKFLQIVLKSQISNSTAKELIKLFDQAFELGIKPKFTLNSDLSILKTSMVCFNCNIIKINDICSNCNILTQTNHFTQIDIRGQIKNIVERNLYTMQYYSRNLSQLGYSDHSPISSFHVGKILDLI